MTLVSLVLALLLEQLRPSAGAGVRHAVSWLADRAGRWTLHHGGRSAVVAWSVVVISGVGASYAMHALFHAVHPVFAVLLNIATLYLALGFRRESTPFSEVHLSLSTGDNEGARQRLMDWVGVDCAHASSGEIARIATEQLLVRAHRRLLGPIFWFVVLPGPTGPVFYRLAETLAGRWRAGARPSAGQGSGDFAERAFQLLEWLPIRLTALSYSVMGNFEDAIYCWRSQSMLWPDKASGILIASGAGALGVRLGLPIHASHTVMDRPEMGVGHKADTEHMQGAAKLVWRVLFMWLMLLGLLGLAGILGR